MLASIRVLFLSTSLPALLSGMDLLQYRPRNTTSLPPHPLASLAVIDVITRMVAEVALSSWEEEISPAFALALPDGVGRPSEAVRSCSHVYRSVANSHRDGVGQKMPLDLIGGLDVTVQLHRAGVRAWDWLGLTRGRQIKLRPRRRSWSRSALLLAYRRFGLGRWTGADRCAALA
jgi:hypothetical protein